MGIVRTEWSTEKLEHITLTDQVRELSLMERQEDNLSRPTYIEQKTYLTNAAHLRQNLNISLGKKIQKDECFKNEAIHLSS